MLSLLWNSICSTSPWVLRWRPPEPVVAWPGIRDARTDNKPTCLQLPDQGVVDAPGWVERVAEIALGYDSTTMNEDCLFVNVQTHNITGSQPVMLYIHGGSNLGGSGSNYKAQMLCDEDVVFVSFNFRLGVLGALALPEALAESGTTGNYMLQDHRAVMNWVQQNIHAFGGDPQRVTISGESSGAMAVAAHLALPKSAPIFSQAIMMSGNDDTISLTEAYASGNRYLVLAGCHHAQDRLACLRRIPSWELVNIQTAVYNQSMRALQVPVADGYEIPLGKRLRDLYASGEVASKPLLAGTNLDDISMFFGLTPKEIIPDFQGQPMVTEKQMRETLPRFFPNASIAQFEEVWKFYNPSNFSSVRSALYNLGTDGYFACPTRRVTKALGRKLPENVFRYVFTAQLSDAYATLVGNPKCMPKWLSPELKSGFDTYVTPWLGSFHGVNEVIFWGSRDHSTSLTSEERALGARMVKHWASFIHTGAPLPSWLPTGPKANESYYAFGVEEDRPGQNWHVHQCDFLERFRFIWNPLTLHGAPFVDVQQHANMISV